ncbi:MAG: hypothetical protein QXR28_04295 [Nitrososphaerota archaeon]
MPTPRSGGAPVPSTLHSCIEPDESAKDERWECDLCGETFTGESAGAGLFVTTRGDEVRYEEPPLCEQCATGITLGALARWRREDEEDDE